MSVQKRATIRQRKSEIFVRPVRSHLPFFVRISHFGHVIPLRPLLYGFLGCARLITPRVTRRRPDGSTLLPGMPLNLDALQLSELTRARSRPPEHLNPAGLDELPQTHTAPLPQPVRKYTHGAQRRAPPLTPRIPCKSLTTKQQQIRQPCRNLAIANEPKSGCTA